MDQDELQVASGGELLSMGGGSGVAALLMANNFDLGCLRPMVAEDGRTYLSINGEARLSANGLLRKDEWILLDQVLIQIARDNLTGIADLRSAGLTVNAGGLGTLIHEFERISDMSAASVSMDGLGAADEDGVDFELDGVPIPIIFKPFRMNIRHLQASRNRGEGLDVTQAAVATRRVADKLEDILFNGSTVKAASRSIYGYRTHGDRNTGSGGDWGTVANIDTNVLAMIAAAEADNFFGPYTLYLHKDQYAQTRVPIDATNQITAMDRLLMRPEIAAVKRSQAMPAGEAVLVQLTRDVVDLSVAADIQNLQWGELGGWVQRFKVFAAMVPRIKSDKDGRCGIVHYTGI